MTRRISIVLGLITGLLVAFIAIEARAEPPAEVLHAGDTYELRPDGSQVRTWHLEIHLLNAAGARREAEQTMQFSPGLETLDLVEAATHKADGRILQAGPDALVELAPRGSSGLDYFTDRRQKVVLLPEAEAGDTIVVTWRRTLLHPLLPGLAVAQYRPSGEPWRDLTLTVRVPHGTVLNTEAHGYTPMQVVEGATDVHRWRADPAATAENVDFGPYDREPRVFVSTWPNWDALARAWAAVALPAAMPTPAIRALAEQLTAGAGSHREAAQRLYDWVSAHIRYIALYRGNGALVPTAAGTVLERGWGDCKDHVALFVALLAARGIAAEMVMVNLDDAATLSGPPTFAQLDHLIAYLPEFGLYVDPTAGTAPFGTLPFSALGKPVVRAVAHGALGRTPTLAPGQATSGLLTRARLGEDGRIEGTTTTTATGPFAADLRHSAQWAEGQGDSAAATQLRTLGLAGSGDFAFATPDADGADYAVSGHFQLDPDPGIIDGNSFAPPTGLRLLVRPGDVLLGPSRGGRTADATFCYAGHQREEIVLLPPGRRLARLPRDVTLRDDGIGYTSRWRVEGNRLSVVRELNSGLPGPVCSGAVRRTAAAALAAIRRDLAAQVALTTP